MVVQTAISHSSFANCVCKSQEVTLSIMTQPGWKLFIQLDCLCIVNLYIKLIYKASLLKDLCAWTIGSIEMLQTNEKLYEIIPGL